MKKISFIVSLFLLFAPLGAPLSAAGLGSDFASLAAQTGLSLPKQAACISDKSGAPLSQNADMRIIPASVSKLYTFDFAMNTLPADFRYTTTFYTSGTTLYINGDGDPHFVIEHLRSVIREAYAKEHVTLNRFVFSPNFYFNWQSNPKDVQLAIFDSLKADTSLPIAARISVVIGASAYQGAGQKYQFQSMPLPALLKQINDYSTNISADTLFRRLGGSAAFAAYMKKTYAVGPETISFATGSGLTGNYTTCALTLRVIKHLNATLDDRDLKLTDIMSMPTVDPGVLLKRKISPTDAQSIVAKSGTLNFHHSLAGAINTTRGLAYFAIFTTYDNLSSSIAVNAMIDRFVGDIAAQYRSMLKSFNYTPDVTLFQGYKITRR